MTVTIRKIAEMAGVSRGTVDRVLNNRGNVSPKVAKRVMLIAQTCGFKPNLIARGLAVRKNDPKRIGVLVNSEDNPFYIDVLKGIWDYADQISDYGIGVVLRTAKGYNIQRQLVLLDELLAEGIDALVVTPINDEEIAQKLNAIIQSGIAVVTLNTDILSVNRLAYVGCDYEKSGRTAAGVLGLVSKNGRDKVGIVTGSIKVLGHNLRISGFGKVLKQDCPGMEIVDVIENNDVDEISRLKVKELLETHPEINALFFTAAGTAGGLRAVEELGLAGKLHIICFDLTPSVREFLKKGVVSAAICQEPYQQGHLSMKYVFDYLMMGRTPEKEISHTDLNIKILHNID